MNTAALAFLGDAVYETYVRRRVLESGAVRGDRLHRAAVEYVRAENQGAAMKALLESLSPEEAALAKRARNRKITSRPRHVDPVEYKWATAFEALVGYLFLSGNGERMEAFIGDAIEWIEGNHGKRKAEKEEGHEE
ncbi:MAG: ribonuclease III domain-containing protein [Bacillota bacterium]|nr:ribonuclease III domain-containing protein [Bacillota bacterium]